MIDRNAVSSGFYVGGWFVDPVHRRIADVPGLYNPSLAVSPDGTSLLYARVVHRGSDILWLE